MTTGKLTTAISCEIGADQVCVSFEPLQLGKHSEYFKLIIIPVCFWETPVELDGWMLPYPKVDFGKSQICINQLCNSFCSNFFLMTNY